MGSDDVSERREIQQQLPLRTWSGPQIPQSAVFGRVIGEGLDQQRILAFA